MSTPQDILLQIQTQLKNSTALEYIADANINLGVRNNVETYPCIFIEPISIEDLNNTVVNIQYLKMRVYILGFVMLDTGNFDEVLADASLNTILKLENDIKKAIDADITLSQKVYNVNYVTTQYEFSSYPIRGIQIEIEIQFKQTTTTRS